MNFFTSYLDGLDIWWTSLYSLYYEDKVSNSEVEDTMDWRVTFQTPIIFVFLTSSMLATILTIWLYHWLRRVMRFLAKRVMTFGGWTHVTIRNWYDYLVLMDFNNLKGHLPYSWIDDHIRYTLVLGYCYERKYSK